MNRGECGERSLWVSSMLKVSWDVLEHKQYITNESLFVYRFNDIELATKSKSALEHRQREEARIRKEANEKWETKVSR